MRKTAPLLFGAHMSISGGISLAIERGESIGCTAIQIFSKSNRQWKARPLQTEEVNAFHSTLKHSLIKSVITHASYLINIGSPNKELAEKSTLALIEELNRCAELSINYLVLHPGSHSNTSQAECLQQISNNIDRALEETNHKTSILIETMAGQGSSVCYSFEQIATIIERSHYKKNIGVCFDTCHAFVAGYDFRTEKTYNDMWELFDNIIGLKKLHAMHINDSKTDLGSRVDRHANIGEGKIGLEAFTLLFNDPRFFDVPKILETPYATLDDHKKNMDIIRSLIT